MVNFQLILIVITTLLFEGCSLETWQRVGYETVQNAKQQECQKDLTRDKAATREDCEKREDYDTYQRKRQETGK